MSLCRIVNVTPDLYDYLPIYYCPSAGAHYIFHPAKGRRPSWPIGEWLHTLVQTVSSELLGFVFSFSYFLVSVPCARLSWPSLQILSIISYRIHNLTNAADVDLYCVYIK